MADAAHTIDPSRRAMLSRMPAAALATGAVLASISIAEAAPAKSPDAELLAMEPEFDALLSEMESALASYREAEGYFFDQKPLKPVFDEQRYLSLYGEAQRAYQVNWGERSRAYKAEVARLKQYSKVDERLDALNAAQDRLCNRLGDLVDMRASTVKGLKFKARMAEHDDDVALSVARDILAL